MSEGSRGKRRFIESPLFPVEAVMEASAKEKGPGRPPFWEMLFWWTRKPLAGARALLLAAALDEDEVLGPNPPGPGARGLHPGVRRFLQAIYPSIDLHKSRPPEKWAFKRTPHYDNPRLPPEWRRKIEQMSVADPMAGYGNIPLEALRLGFGAVYYWDLLPIARLILRAVLEYPARYGEQLARDVKRYGEELVRRLREDPDLQELYDPDTAVYIGTWEVKCPYCGRYTPLVGNWWLARVKDNKGQYKALAWMHPQKNPDGTITIKIKDLTPHLKNAHKIEVTKTTVKIDGETHHVPEPNINARTRTAVCLHCGAKIRPLAKNTEWPVRQAIREWNQNLDRYLEGEITLEQLLQSPARPTIIAKIKVKDNQLTIHPATPEDQQKLWKALQKLQQQYPDPDIPTDPLWPYTSETAGNLSIIIWGFDKFYKLFNPRQLLTHTKTIKHIRQIAKQIIQEQQKYGKTQEQAKQYANTITTYLVLSFLKIIDYNSINTSWNPPFWAPIKIQHTLALRGISIQWNWSDNNIIYNKLLSYNYMLEKIIKSIKYLLINLNYNIIKSINIFNLVTLDPPYFDDVPYAELSDFYYVWARRALSDSDGERLLPLFHEDLFWDEFGGEIRTQWERFAVDDLTFNPGRMKYFGLCRDREECLRVYRERFVSEFRRVSGMLSDDGLLVVYFAHSRREAWELLVEAAWASDLWVSAGFPLATESPTSVVSRGKASILQSLVLVLRRGRGGELDLAAAEEGLVGELAGYLGRVYGAGHVGFTAYAMTYARALGLLMRYRVVRRGGRELDASGVVSEAARLAARAFAVESGARLRSEEAVLYLLLKRVLPRREGGARRVESDGLIILGYGTMEPGEAEKKGVVRGLGRPGSGANVAKRKVFEVLEPVDASEREAARLLSLVPRRGERFAPRGVVDVLRVLEYYGLRPRSVFLGVYEELEREHGPLVEEAVELARALCSAFSYVDERGRVQYEDPEAVLAENILKYLKVECPRRRLGGEGGGVPLTRFMG